MITPDATLYNLQARAAMAVMATLRGPGWRQEQHSAEEWRLLAEAEAQEAACRAALNSYRPLAWDDAHP